MVTCDNLQQKPKSKLLTVQTWVWCRSWVSNLQVLFRSKLSAAYTYKSSVCVYSILCTLCISIYPWSKGIPHIDKPDLRPPVWPLCYFCRLMNQWQGNFSVSLTLSLCVFMVQTCGLHFLPGAASAGHSGGWHEYPSGKEGAHAERLPHLPVPGRVVLHREPGERQTGSGGFPHGQWQCIVVHRKAVDCYIRLY